MGALYCLEMGASQISDGLCLLLALEGPKQSILKIMAYLFIEELLGHFQRFEV